MTVGGRTPAAQCNNAVAFVWTASTAELETVRFDHIDEAIEEFVSFDGGESSRRVIRDAEAEFTKLA